MKLIDLGEVALTESSLEAVLDEIVLRISPRGSAMKGGSLYQAMIEEAVVIIDRRLFFAASAICNSDDSPVKGIHIHTDHFLDGEATWSLCLGGYIASAVEP